MPTIHYYGKKTNFVGKTLFEILANLRNFGINRMLVKQEESIKYPGHKNYYIVKKVEPVMDEKLEEGIIYAERIFKGSRIPGLVLVDDESWHPDWQLIPRHEESKYRVENPPLYEPPQIEPSSFEPPPLMKRFLERFYKMKGVELPNGSITIPLNYTPTDIEYDVDRRKPVSMALSERFRRRNEKT